MDIYNQSVRFLQIILILTTLHCWERLKAADLPVLQPSVVEAWAKIVMSTMEIIDRIWKCLSRIWHITMSSWHIPRLPTWQTSRQHWFVVFPPPPSLERTWSWSVLIVEKKLACMKFANHTQPAFQGSKWVMMSWSPFYNSATNVERSWSPILITSAASNGAGASFGSLAEEGISGGWEGSDHQHGIIVINFQGNEFYHGAAYIDSYLWNIYLIYVLYLYIRHG